MTPRPVLLLAAAVSALLLCATGAAAAPLGATMPTPRGEPGGIYAGTVRVVGVSAKGCRGCRARFVLTDDGREITRASGIGFARRVNPCDGTYPSTMPLVRIGEDGRWKGQPEDSIAMSTLRGAVSRRAITLSGTLSCESDRRFTARLKLVGHVPDRRGRAVECDRLGRLFDAKAIMLVSQRDIGCGAAHDAARALGTGACGIGDATTCTLGPLACARIDTGALEPAAQTRCAFAAPPDTSATPPRDTAIAEITQLRDCTPKDLDDDDGRLSLYVSSGVTCEQAAAVGRPCEFSSEACESVGGFTCKLIETDSGAYTTQRCSAASDPRRLIVLSGYSSDNA